LLTQNYFDDFNKNVFDNVLSEVKVIWSPRLRTTAGVTRLKQLFKTTTYGKGTKSEQSRKEAFERIASIDLSSKVIDSEDRLRETLLHEMCHAAQWLVDGVSKPPHGESFKKWGNIATKITGLKVTTTHEYVISYKFAWACTECKMVVKRQSRSIDTLRQVCGRCRGKLIEIEVPQSNSSLHHDLIPRKKKEASGFSLFVKENSKEVRKRLVSETPSSKIMQKDVMKECGRLWSEQKRAVIDTKSRKTDL